MGDYFCLDCETELDYLDAIIKSVTGNVMHWLYICRNENCDHCGQIYYVKPNGEFGEGDPSGIY